MFYASGDAQGIQAHHADVEGFAAQVYDVGPFGNGSQMKYVANLLVAINNVATAEAMVLGMKAGLAPQLIFDLIKGGAGNSRIFELRAPMMVKNNYNDASMKIDVWHKDMSVIGAYARKIKVPTPIFDASMPIYLKAMKAGLGAQDTAAVCAVLEKMAKVSAARPSDRADVQGDDAPYCAEKTDKRQKNPGASNTNKGRQRVIQATHRYIARCGHLGCSFLANLM